MNVLRTIIVPAALVTKARNLGAALAPTGEGMYTTALSATGNLPATHYVSSGLIHEPPFAELLGNANALFTAAQEGANRQGKAIGATQNDTNDLVAQSFVGDETQEPHAFIASKGLQIINSVV